MDGVARGLGLVVGCDRAESERARVGVADCRVADHVVGTRQVEARHQRRRAVGERSGLGVVVVVVVLLGVGAWRLKG